MRVRWRHMRQYVIHHVLAVCVIVVKACQRLSWRLFALTSVCFLFLWWMRSGQDLLCDGQAVQNQICLDYVAHSVSGDLCYDLCYERLFQLSGCGSEIVHGTIKKFQVLRDGRPLHDTSAVVSLATPDLLDGLSMSEYTTLLSGYLANQLDRGSDLATLVTHFRQFFDFNRDGILSYGEAQTVWKVLHQPQFLNNYLFQNTGAMAHLNGTCGGLTLWSHKPLWSRLFSRQALWPLSLLYPKVFHMTLPSWPRRAKVTVSLLELAEDLMENFGARFHLCNISGESLFHSKEYEILISDATQLMSGRQIQAALANRTCHHDHDCRLTPQCQTKCNLKRKTCSRQLIRPTVAYICDLIKDYLIFDTPKSIRRQLDHRVRVCRNLWWSSSPSFLITHSVAVTDLKRVLWDYIQDLKV